MKTSQYRFLMFWVLLIYAKVSILSSNGTLAAESLVVLGFTMAACYLVGTSISYRKERQAKNGAKPAEQQEVHP